MQYQANNTENKENISNGIISWFNANFTKNSEYYKTFIQKKFKTKILQTNNMKIVP